MIGFERVIPACALAAGLLASCQSQGARDRVPTTVADVQRLTD